MEQHIMTHAQWIEAGGWEPTIPGGAQPDWVVIVGVDTATGEAKWASWERPDVDPATRLNPDLPAVDFR